MISMVAIGVVKKLYINKANVQFLILQLCYNPNYKSVLLEI